MARLVFDPMYIVAHHTVYILDLVGVSAAQSCCIVVVVVVVVVVLASTVDVSAALDCFMSLRFWLLYSLVVVVVAVAFSLDIENISHGSGTTNFQNFNRHHLNDGLELFHHWTGLLTHAGITNQVGCFSKQFHY